LKEVKDLLGKKGTKNPPTMESEKGNKKFCLSVKLMDYFYHCYNVYIRTQLLLKAKIIFSDYELYRLKVEVIGYRFRKQ
jgi:hypothetical protein